jgi:ribosomal-protein-alanine N-acetyltransferase
MLPAMPELTPVTLTTPRLQLRWVDQGDAAALFAIFSNPLVTRYWSTPPWSSIAQAEQSIRDSQLDYQSGSALRLGIVLRESGELIGHIKLYAIMASNRRCDIGYALAQAHWGKGYLGEAMQATLDYAFGTLGLNRIEADIDPRNDASEKLLLRMAFQKEGYMRERWIVNGEICDTAFYGLLKRDWKARRLTDK